MFSYFAFPDPDIIQVIKDCCWELFSTITYQWTELFRAAPFFIFLITFLQDRMFCFGIIDL